MESRLPKPSALKKPTAVAKSVLPMDRIRQTSFVSSGIVNRIQLGASVQSLNTIQVLSRDPTNIQTSITVSKKERAASPDAGKKSSSMSRGKLRRSRSACDIRDLKSIRRIDSTLAPIPAKISRLMTTTAICGNQGNNKPPRIGSSNATTVISSSTTKRPIHSQSSNNQTTLNCKRANTTTSTGGSSGGANKIINKRIPPYDYKARFNDLLEKHKKLKEDFDKKNELIVSLENLPEILEDTQNELIATQEELKTAKTLTECLQRQNKLHHEQFESIKENLRETTKQLDSLTKTHNRLQLDHENLNKEVVELRDKSRTLEEYNYLLMDEIGVCKEQLFRSNMERKELHNTVLDLRGNIRVFCRVRPTLDCEQDRSVCGWNYIDEATVEIVNNDVAAKNKNTSYIFNFDQVFHPASDQVAIFEMVSPLIQSALDGYNICIFAYGQTGSGKTYTMDGAPNNPGVIPRTVDLLFDSVKNYKSLGWQYEIKVTFLEIYNEVLYDLLSNEPKEMEIRMVKNSKNDIYVSNITQETVESAESLRALMQLAKMNRATAATVGNERSSRSHAVTKIELIGCHAEKKEISLGSINLVDLAGSESPKTSTRMNETKNINRSLSELTNVILALLQKQDHIPYRNSKLTHLLMPSLGGNSKTLMFINVAPLQDCFAESLKSLRFAATVNQCKMAKAKRNRVHNNSLVNSSSFGN